MGVDAVIRLEIPPPERFYPVLAEQFRQDWPAELPIAGQDWPYLDTEGEVHTLWRYYGYGYERGHWPQIRELIEWLGTHTESMVLYGSDLDDELTPATREFLDDMTAHYDAVGNEPYEAGFRRPPQSGRIDG